MSTIVTQRQFPRYHKYEMELAGRPLTLEAGKLAETLDLSKDQEVTIHGAHNGVNRLVVKDGEIWCEEATCPDQVCVHQGKQSRDGEMIVCLPSLMIVQVKGEER